MKAGREASETVRKGSMPPGYYVLVHPDVQLSVTVRQMLRSWLATSSGGPTRQRGTTIEGVVRLITDGPPRKQIGVEAG